MSGEMTIDLALIRWSVVHLRWDRIGGSAPYLPAFMAGWFCRSIGASEPNQVGQFRDSFRAGWKEASDQIEINNRTRQSPKD